MSAIFFDARASDAERRRLLFSGSLFVFPPRPSTLALCRLARELIEREFAPLDPTTAQFALSPPEFTAVVERYAAEFAASPRTAAAIQAVLADFGCDPAATYFAAPQSRASTSHGYHTSIQSATYTPYWPPHRDSWYSGILCAVNWWVPVYDLAADNGLAFYPTYWQKAVPDGRELVERQARAASSGRSDGEKRPGADEQVRLVCPAGGVLVFCGAQLHASVPNTSGRTRFSFDLRTVHLGDVREARGAPNVDSRCPTSQLRHYRRAADLALLPDAVATAYEERSGAAAPGSVAFGELLFLLQERRARGATSGVR